MFKIGKSDWILYKKKLAAWQNNHMQHLLEEYQEIINSRGEPVDRFWELEKRINKDKRKRGVVCELSRSSVIDNLLTLYGEKFAFEVCHTLKQTFQLTKFQDQASVEVL